MLHWTDLGASKEKNMWFCNLPIPTVWTSSPEGKPCGFWDFILWCFDLFFCLEQLMMFQSGFVDLGGMMFPDDILLKSVYDWCNVLRPWIKSAGLKGSKRGGKVPVPAKLGRSMGCYSLEPRADKAILGTLRWVSPGWWREGGAATCSWSSLSSSIATSAGQHGGYAHEPAISSYHSDPIYGW